MQKFVCKGEKCKHSCCENWQIDIDKKTLKKYKKFSFSDDRFLKNIDYNNASFLCGERKRCPFLNGKNLCDIIIEYGENHLCKTCKTHPRFINYFNGFKEIGATLSCEYSAKLIVENKSKLRVVESDNRGGVKSLKKVLPTQEIALNPKISPFFKDLLKTRNKLIKIAQDRKLSIAERLSKLIEYSKVDLLRLSIIEWVKVLSGLEILDLRSLKLYNYIIERGNAEVNFDERFSSAYENVLSYLLFKNVGKAQDQIDILLYTALSVLGLNIISSIFEFKGDKSLQGLAEACRIYSSEIEYSELNEQRLLDKLEDLVKMC